MLVMISRMSVPICNHFHVGGANSGRITPFKGMPLFCPLVRGTPFAQRHEILSRNTRDSRPVSISPGLETVPGCDGQTDRQTELP